MSPVNLFNMRREIETTQAIRLLETPRDAGEFNWADVLFPHQDPEANVLKLRFGLEGHRSQTLEEVRKIFGVTRERIRQIEAKALRKMRHPTRSQRLKGFLE